MTPDQKNSPAHEAGQSSKHKTILPLIRRGMFAMFSAYVTLSDTLVLLVAVAGLVAVGVWK